MAEFVYCLPIYVYLLCSAISLSKEWKIIVYWALIILRVAHEPNERRPDDKAIATIKPDLRREFWNQPATQVRAPIMVGVNV